MKANPSQNGEFTTLYQCISAEGPKGRKKLRKGGQRETYEGREGRIFLKFQMQKSYIVFILRNDTV